MMKFLVICLLLYELRVAFPAAHGVWLADELVQPNNFTAWSDREATIEEDRFWKAKLVPVWLGGFREQKKRIANEEYRFPRARAGARSACSCETEYDTRDLGDGHYPRYITASKCKPGTCQSKFHSCRLLHYMVHVLRQRETMGPPTMNRNLDDNTLPESPLPESIRHKWQLKPMWVPVACIAASDGKRN